MNHIHPGNELSEPARISTVFFGTPAFAVPALRAIAGDPRFDVRLVVTQPDRPAGRGRRLARPPVKDAAAELGLPIYQTASLRTPELRAPVAQIDADVFVVAAFGVIFGPKFLALPRTGCVNVHASLLPAYRGASPISAAIARGETESGVSLMVMDTGLDTGDVFASAVLPINAVDTTESLTGKLAETGADLLRAHLAEFARGSLTPVAQPCEGASITRPLAKADGWIDWTASAHQIERLTRAMWPWPRAWTTLEGEPFQIHTCSILESVQGDAATREPGTIFRSATNLAVRCGAHAIVLERVQRAGGRPIEGHDLLRTQPHLEGALLGRVGGPAHPPGPFVTELG